MKQKKGIPNHRLLHERLKQHWSQREVAAKLNTSFVNISRWERGVTTPGPYFRYQLCELFGKQPQELGLLVEQTGEESLSTSLPLLDVPNAPFSAPTQHVPHWHVPYSSNSFFTGREEVLHQLVREICTEPKRVQAITGLPGVGKTSLAIELAHHPQIQERFRDGLLWIGLGPAPQLAEAMNSWVTLLGITSAEAQTLTTVDTMARWLHQRLRDRQMLFILDDAWKISDAVTFQLGGEQCVHVLTTRSPQLAYTFARECVTSLQPLSEAASMRLLQHLAPLASHRYPRELQALIQPSGGLPLALTLLGRSVHVQSLYGSSRRLLQTLQHLSQNIQTRFQIAEPVPVGDARPSAPMGTDLSLRTTIDLSIQQLSPLARRAFHALAVFAPTPLSFSEEAALAICDTSARTFDTLVDNGLVELCQQERYQIHQTILDYAQLQKPDPVVVERLIAFIVPFVERHATEMQILSQDLYLITTAFERAFTRYSYPLLLRGIFALQPFIEQRRLYPLAQTLLLWGQLAACSLHDREQLARICLFRGKMADLCGETQQAQQAYFEGLALARELHHQELITLFVVLVGGTLLDTEAGSQAEAYLTEGLRDIERIANDAPRSLVFRYLGELAYQVGEIDKATVFYQRGLQIALQTQHWKAVSELLQNMGAQAAQRGDYAQAAASYAEGLTYARQLGDLQRQSALLMNLGMLAWYEQKQDKAIRLSQESLQLAREIGHSMRISSVLQNLGMMMRVQNQDTQAEEYLQESLDVAQAIGHCWLICETLGEVGLLALKQRQITQAKQIFGEMQRQAQEIRAPLLQALALFGFAQVAEQEGQRGEALRFAQESLALFAQLNNTILIQEIEIWRATLPEHGSVRK